jgi:hypothetical protein
MYKNTKSSHKFVQKAIVPRAALPNTVFTEEECSFSFKFSRNVKPNLKIQNPHLHHFHLQYRGNNHATVAKTQFHPRHRTSLLF